MRSGNPALKPDTFTGERARFGGGGFTETMTAKGAVNKALFLILLVVAPASYVWKLFYEGTLAPEMLGTIVIGGSIVGLVLAMVTIFKKNVSPVTAPLYALCEGALMGALSASFEMRYPGIVIQAVGLTMGVFTAMLLAYKSGFVRATEKFKMGVAAATGGVMILYLVNLGMSFFGSNVPFIHSTGMVGVGFSCLVVAIAAFNLILDFDFIEKGESARAPKYMEWYAAFSLLVTLVWLYMEILRLLSKSRSRN